MDNPQEPLITVKEFAQRTNRFRNQVYCLINYGNKHRKLESVKVKGMIMIPEREVNEFPFNKEVKLKNELTPRIEALEERVDRLEEINEN